MIARAILYLISNSEILSILFNSISGEIFTAIGTLLFSFFFYTSIASKSSFNSFSSWKLLKFSVFGDEIFIVK